MLSAPEILGGQNPQQEELARVLKTLPLETCTYEEHPALGMEGWRTPKNRSFRITGQFETGTVALPSFIYYDYPRLSKEMLIAEYSNQYEECLARAKGNEKSAFRMLLAGFDKDYYPYAGQSFTGKWLMIDSKSGEIEIFKDAEADAFWAGRNIYTEDISKGLEIDPQEVAPQLFGQSFTMRASGPLGKFQVEMIRTRDKKPQLVVPRYASRLVMPRTRDYSLTSTDWCDTLYGTGNYTEEERLGWMRKRREEGATPFGDDPLRNLVLPTKWDIIQRLRTLNVSATEARPRPIIIFPGQEK